MSGRRVAKGDDFMLYMMASVILGAALAVVFAYVVFQVVSVASFVLNVLSMGMG